jgi:hypothetical protein
LNQWSGDSDFIPVKLAVGGTMESPVLGIDADALATALREHAQSQGLGQLQDVGRNLLQQLVAPDQQDSAEQAP